MPALSKTFLGGFEVFKGLRGAPRGGFASKSPGILDSRPKKLVFDLAMTAICAFPASTATAFGRFLMSDAIVNSAARADIFGDLKSQAGLQDPPATTKLFAEFTDETKTEQGRPPARLAGGMGACRRRRRQGYRQYSEK